MNGHVRARAEGARRWWLEKLAYALRSRRVRRFAIVGGSGVLVNAGFLFGRDRPDVKEPPPRLGEHSEAILEQLGFPAAERKLILE